MLFQFLFIRIIDTGLGLFGLLFFACVRMWFKLLYIKYKCEPIVQVLTAAEINPDDAHNVL